MRIVELLNTLEVGGTERMAVDLSIALRDRGHHVSVMCLRGEGPLADRLRLADIEVISLGKRDGPDVRALSRLIKWVKQNRIDIVHTHNPLVHHYGAVAGRVSGVRGVVNTIHGVGNLSRKRGLREWLFSTTCYFTDQVVAVCPMAHREFGNLGVIPKDKLVTINNGIDVDVFGGIRERRSGDEFVFGIVGRLVPVKDHHCLLCAFATVLTQLPRCRLTILGDGPLRVELEQRAGDLGIAGKVRFLGYGSDVAGFYRTVDAAVLCSVSEGLPLSALEAMAAGVPIVATSVGGLPDLVNGSACGWLCPPGKPEALAAVMLEAAMFRDESCVRGERGRSFAVAEYSLGRMADSYEQLFIRLSSAASRWVK